MESVLSDWPEHSKAFRVNRQPPFYISQRNKDSVHIFTQFSVKSIRRPGHFGLYI